MSTLLGDARVRVRADTKGFEGEARRGIEGPLKAVAKRVAGVMATVGVASILKDSVTAASDLGESMSKVGVVFGKSSKQIVAASKKSATAVGLTSQAYLEATGTLGNLLVALKLPKKSAADMSQAMVALAGDLASFNNVSPEEALEALRSGLVGETEPLKKFGVNMNEATLKAQALKMGLVKTTKEALDPQKKALAAYALIMDQTGTAQGDFARTSGGLANQQRILAAKFGDLKASIGKGLLPVVTDLATFANDTLIPSLYDIGGGFKGIYDLVVKGDFTSALSNAFGWSEDSAPVDFILDIRDAITNDVLPALTTLGENAKTALSNFAGKVDLSGLLTSIKEAATEAGGALISGIQTGLDTGDWKPLGLSLGNGIREALKTLGSMAKDLAKAVGDFVAKVDWISLGIDAGKQVVPFVIGLALGILNFDIVGVIKGLGDHWKEALMGILAIAFAPAKLLGPIAKILGKIPLVGRFIEWFLLAINGVGSKILGWVGGLLKRFGEGFKAGGPGLISRVLGVFDDIWVRLYVWADDLVIWFKGLPGRFSEWLGDLAMRAGIGIRLFVDAMTNPIRRLIGWIIQQHARLGRWVFDKIVAGVGLVRDAIGRFIKPITDTLGTLRKKGEDGVKKLIGGLKSIDLAKVGRDMLDGLGRGLTDMGTKVRSWATSIKDKIVGEIKTLFDINSPSRVMSELGGHMVDGLLVGLSNGKGAIKSMVRSVFGDPVQFLKTQGGKIGGLVKAIPGFASSAVKKVPGLLSSGASWLQGLGENLAAPSGGGSQTKLISLGRQLQGLGYNVGEHPLFGGVAPVHTKGSAHYSGRAIDINADGMPGGEKAAIDRIMPLVKAMGFKTIWQAPGHYDHLHAAYDRGGIASGLGFMPKATLKPERVLSPSQTAAFEDWMRGKHETQAAAPLIGGDLVLQSSGNTRDDLALTTFTLRKIRRGGVHA